MTVDSSPVKFTPALPGQPAPDIQTISGDRPIFGAELPDCRTVLLCRPRKHESVARAAALRFGKGTFPWAASGRSLSLGRDKGLTKLLFDEASGRVIGVGIVGPYAGELVAEIAEAMEMGADAADLAPTIHPHPTLSETVGLAAEAFEGTITDLYLPKKK